ncbi:MAG: S8 family serine peptidase, partial [Anaerolineae bacterium]
MAAKVEPALLKRMLGGSTDSYHRLVIEMAHRADLDSLPRDQSREKRHSTVVGHLQQTASEIQADLLAFLQEEKAKGRVREIQPFWIFNGIAVTADSSTVLNLAARQDIGAIREDRWRQWIDPLAISDPDFIFSSSEPWNILQIQADRAWDALGLDGSGVTIAIMDTGVDWQHPALQAQYRGYKEGGLAIHQGNWLCTTDEGYLYPVDGNGHGTHVAGIAVGSLDDQGQAIGVAPGAQWIAVKMLNNGCFGYD